MRTRVHVLGNSVVDILVPGVWPEGQAGDAWAGNVSVLRQPVRVTLGGCGAAPAYVLGRLVYGLAAGEPVPKAVQAAVELASAAVRSGCGVLGAFVQAPP